MWLIIWQVNEDLIMGFFTVTDIPDRRVVQYKRATSEASGAVYLADDSVLGDSLDSMPYADKTGLAVKSGFAGTLYEVPYLAEAGDVYFSTQPESRALNKTTATKLTAAASAGKSPYTYQWYKDDKQVVNVPNTDGTLSITEPGKYMVVVTDADGKQAYSKAADIVASGEEVPPAEESAE